MGGKAKFGKDAKKVSRAAIEAVWEGLALQMEHFSLRAKLCGSYRRGKEMIGDMDVVFIPAPGVNVPDEAIDLYNQINHTPGKKTALVFDSFEGPVQCDFYCATFEDWGAQLLTWSGDKLFNIILRSRAKKKGYKLSQYGLWSLETGECLAGENEHDIFEKLGMRFVEPELRNKNKSD